ncbi:MAG: DUF3800 domain-containing protein [Deltaproteobacteria bacterium]|nr:DUF3800 domain-containing protein [Deltaproteobacteria bacterium]
MNGSAPHSLSRPSKFEDRFRLYLDESGDHVFREVKEVSHRFLCLLGCWFRNPDYLKFHEALEALKSRFLPHHPDDPVVLHREDMLNARKAFKALRDPVMRAEWDEELLAVIAAAEFRVVGVVIDKLALRHAYGDSAAHPYHLGLGFMLQRYAGYLNHINRTGDVMAESRGEAEDRLLKESYTHVYERGVWTTPAHSFRAALTSCQLKLKGKAANISGLQLADLLGHPVKQWILRQQGFLEGDPPSFAQRLMGVVEEKLNRQLYTGRIEGYGTVFSRKNKKASLEALLRSPLRAIHLRLAD